MAFFAGEIRNKCRGEILENEPLAKHTSLKVGGPAEVFITPADRADLVALMSVIVPAGIPFLVIGGGFNLLVRDGGFRGVAISLERFDELELKDEGVVSAGAGTTNARLVHFAQKHEMTGLEFLIGVPGTVGGSLAVNAGAHGKAILDRVEALTTLSDGQVHTRPKTELDFDYRFLRLAEGEIIVEANFRLKQGKAEEIRSLIDAYLEHRRHAQQVSSCSAGSFFKNPPGQQAWRLIDEAGLRGASVGGARVSEEHANFLVNTGAATAADFLELARLVRLKVRETSGFDLEEEVRIIGEA